MKHRPKEHWRTPQKAVIQHEFKKNAAGQSLGPDGQPLSQRKLFRDKLKVPRTSGYRVGSSNDPRRLNNSKIRKETRGRKSKVSERDVRAVELLLWREGPDGRQLSWDALAIEAALSCGGRTLQRKMVHKGYRRYIACRKSWVAPKIAEKRVEWARKMLAQRPRPEDWYDVRFSDETHLGYGPPGRVYVTRRPEEIYCNDCTQIVNQPKVEDEKKVHGWGVVGYKYKSPLVQY
jgi:hypothetical protein